MTELVLYMTESCHLCEEAEAVILAPAHARGLQLIKVDISTNDALIDRYGLSIPVLAMPERNRELGWPFSGEELCLWLDA